jgi:hypothetical protein
MKDFFGYKREVRPCPRPQLCVPDDAWQEDEEGRLNVSVDFLGIQHHVTALPIREPLPTEEHVTYMGATPFIENYIDDLMVAFGAGEAFAPVTINTKRYLVFLCPSTE